MGGLEKRSKAERFIIKTIFWLLALAFVYDLFVGPEEVTTPGAAGTETTLNGGYACVSEELLDQFVLAVGNKDARGVRHLLGNGCVLAKKGTPVSILDYSWGSVKVRAYANDGTVVSVWTDIKNIDK